MRPDAWLEVGWAYRLPRLDIQLNHACRGDRADRLLASIKRNLPCQLINLSGVSHLLVKDAEIYALALMAKMASGWRPNQWVTWNWMCELITRGACPLWLQVPSSGTLALVLVGEIEIIERWQRRRSINRCQQVYAPADGPSPIQIRSINLNTNHNTHTWIHVQVECTRVESAANT